MQTNLIAFVATLLLGTAVAVPVARDEIGLFAGMKRDSDCGGCQIDLEPSAGTKRDGEIEHFIEVKREEEIESIADIIDCGSCE